MKINLKLVIIPLLVISSQSCMNQKFLVSTNVAYNSELSKEMSHFIVPLSNNSSIADNNLYPIIKRAMIRSGIKVVNKASEAKYLVTYETRYSSQSIQSTRYIPTTSTTVGSLYSPSSSNSLNYSQTTTSGTYMPYSYENNMLGISISAYDKKREVWRVLLVATDQGDLDLSQMVDAAFVNYGQKFKTWVPFN
jgi:hypothetical protein